MNQDTAKFLNALYGNLESGNLYLWTLPDHRTWSFPIGDLGIMTKAAEAMQDERDVYYGVGGSMHPIADNNRPLANNVSFIPALWMDIDILGPAHKQTDLPKTVEEALSIIPEFLRPSITTWSGNGLHAYWLLKECWIFDTQEENLRASNLMLRLQAYIKSLAQERGWKLDSTADLSRVLRVPGTLNHKLGQKQPVYITNFDETIRYDPSELEDLIPDIDFRAAITNHGSFERRSTDASSDLMIANCQFLQHCLHHAGSITYGEWLSMLTNVVRGTDGIDKCHELSSPDKGRYTPKGTDFRLSEALKMNPQTCEYIRTNHGFSCPSGGCGVKSPCSFSLGIVDIARAKVNMIGIPSADKIFNEDMLSALSIVKKQDAALYAKAKDKLRGTINLVDLERAIKQHTQKITNSEVGEIPTDNITDLPSASAGASATDIEVSPTLEIVWPDNFKVTSTGIRHTRFTENGPIVTRACGCPAIITARLFNADTETESLKISYKHMGRWRDIVIPRSMAVDSRRVIALADKGISVSSEGAKYLAKYFDDYLFCNPDIPIQKAVSRFGWRGKEFVFPGLTNEIEIDVDDIGSKHALKGFSVAGDYSEWKTVANTVRNYSPNARFVLSSGFAAPLLRPLSQRNFIVHNHGDSQGGKTAALWLSMSVWGDPNIITSSWDGTSTSMERRASLFSDLPLGINEREVLSQIKKQDISATLYMLAEGKGKGRGGKAGLQELNMWRTIVLSTGEGPLASASSMDGLMTRTIEIEGGPLAGYKDYAQYLYSFLPYSHGHAGLAFMRALMGSQMGEIVDYYRQAQGWLRQFYNDKIDSHLDALSCVMTADYYSSIWVFGLDPSVAGGEAVAMATAIAERLIKRVDASESERAWLEFMDWVGENSEYLKDTFTTKKIGAKDGTNIYIIRRVVDEFLGKYSSAQKIIKAWAEQGKIEQRVDSEGKLRFAIQKKLGGAIVRCIVFKERTEGLFDS